LREGWRSSGQDADGDAESLGMVDSLGMAESLGAALLGAPTLGATVAPELVPGVQAMIAAPIATASNSRLNIGCPPLEYRMTTAPCVAAGRQCQPTL
jgi:hypothetical protein